MNTALTRLSTGRRINSGADDPAGLIAMEALSAQIATLEVESRNAARVDSYAAIAEGGLSEVSELASELRGHLTAAANTAGLSDEEVAAHQMEIDNIVAAMDRAAGPALETLERLNLPDDTVGQFASEMSAALAEAKALTSGGSNDLSSGNYEEAMQRVDSVISSTATLRGSVGSYQRYTLDSQVRSSQVALESLTASRSRIADTDYALESANLNIAQIKRAASAKALKIARSLPENVLDLLA